MKPLTLGAGQLWVHVFQSKVVAKKGEVNTQNLREQNATNYNKTCRGIIRTFSFHHEQMQTVAK